MSTEGASARRPSDHPTVLMPVAIRVSLPGGASGELPTRVSDVEIGAGGARTVVVPRPDLSGLAEPGMLPRPGEEVLLQWPHDSGQMQVPATVAAARRPYGPVWELTPTGPPKRVQRRDFFRIPLALPVHVVALDGDVEAQAPLQGTLVDLSEGGALTLLHGELPAPGAEVEVVLRVAGKELTPRASVVRHVTFPSGEHGLALRFTDPDRYGDLIRQVAFAEQRRLASQR